MQKIHLQTLLVLADRARRAGLVDFNEFSPVAQAVEAAQKILNEQAENTTEVVQESERKPAESSKK
jgi:hypothetical protein